MSKDVKKKEMRRAEDQDLGRLYIDEDLKEDGFEYRIVNDSPGRIRYLERLGYEIVRDHKIKPGSGSQDEISSSGSAVELEVGKYQGSQRAVLMRISKEDYAERQLMKKERIDKQTQMLGETGIPTQYGEVSVGTQLK